MHWFKWLIVAWVLGSFVVTALFVHAKRRARAFYRATTQPCIVPQCGRRIPKKYDFTDVFCPEHWLQLPKVIKRALAAEAASCRRARGATHAFTQILKAAVKSVQ